VLFAYTDHIRAVQPALPDDARTGAVASKKTITDRCNTSDSDSTDDDDGGCDNEKACAKRSEAKSDVSRPATGTDDKQLHGLAGNKDSNTKAKPSLRRALRKRVSSQLLRPRRLSLYFPGVALLYQASTSRCNCSAYHKVYVYFKTGVRRGVHVLGAVRTGGALLLHGRAAVAVPLLPSRPGTTA
jgi:hypothetical protein